jgi:hypothetical protein
MVTYKITALKPVTVTAYVWYRGSRPTAKDHQGSTLPPVAAIKNRSECFDLEQGESRDDISFLEKVGDVFCTITLPEKVGETVTFQDVLRIVRTSDEKPSL